MKNLVEETGKYVAWVKNKTPRSNQITDWLDQHQRLTENGDITLTQYRDFLIIAKMAALTDFDDVEINSAIHLYATVHSDE